MNFSKNLVLWVIIAVLLAALFNLFQNSTTPHGAAPYAYSDFLTDVDAGKVFWGPWGRMAGPVYAENWAKGRFHRQFVLHFPHCSISRVFAPCRTWGITAIPH